MAHDTAFKTARAKAKDDATVVDWINWAAKGSDYSPWLVRRPLGLGSVTWVAQNLGDSQLSLATPGWPMIWDHVFGWNNTTRVNPSDDVIAQFTQQSAEAPNDLAKSLFEGIDQSSRGDGLLGVALLFFVLYWIVAGPGSFLFLASRKRKEMSWFIFGAAAIVAAAFTGLLVKLILRGDPELTHTSIAQAAMGDHTHVLSRIGLYIPRDGNQSLDLTDTATDAQTPSVPRSSFPLGPTAASPRHRITPSPSTTPTSQSPSICPSAAR